MPDAQIQVLNTTNFSLKMPFNWGTDMQMNQYNVVPQENCMLSMMGDWKKGVLVTAWQKDIWYPQNIPQIEEVILASLKGCTCICEDLRMESVTIYVWECEQWK